MRLETAPLSPISFLRGRTEVAQCSGQTRFESLREERRGEDGRGEEKYWGGEAGGEGKQCSGKRPARSPADLMELNKETERGLKEEKSSKISRFHVVVIPKCLFSTLNSGGDARINYSKIDVKKRRKKEEKRKPSTYLALCLQSPSGMPGFSFLPRLRLPCSLYMFGRKLKNKART